jgi:regulator of extracellular matrix RemA (YlzA/DUF370 family)
VDHKFSPVDLEDGCFVPSGRVVGILSVLDRSAAKVLLAAATTRNPDSVLDSSGKKKRQSVVLLDNHTYWCSSYSPAVLKNRVLKADPDTEIVDMANDDLFVMREVVAILDYRKEPIKRLVSKSKEKYPETVIDLCRGNEKKSLVMLSNRSYVISHLSPTVLINRALGVEP